MSKIYVILVEYCMKLTLYSANRNYSAILATLQMNLVRR
jgi:hypothetical protein